MQNLSINNITKSGLQDAFNTLADTLSPKTLKSVYGFFNAVISEYSGHGLKIILLKLHKRIYNTPDQETSKKILECAKGTDIEVPINLALRCGLRISEVCGLKWSAVHDDFITIDNVIVSYGTESIEKLPKSAAGCRNIPIPEDLKKMINSLPHVTNYIVNKNSNAIGASFQRFLKNNNFSPMRFHDLRHGFASAMAMQGIPEAYAMAIGGWDTPDVLHSIYEQTFDSQKNSFAQKTQDYFK